MTPLAEKMAALIRASGPITVADYMTMCLADPEYGYYMRREPFGRTGDFITAPEISQIFGELIGLWCVAVWEMMGGPRRFVLAELGPGRGTLMADMLRTAKIKPDFLRAADIHLVEMSPRLRDVQREKLSASGLPLHWHGNVADLPPGPAIVIANEFFDALPVRQFQWIDKRWNERVVGLSDAGALTFGLMPVDQRPAGVPLPDGAIIEASPAGKAVMTTLAERLKRSGGAALIVDYGAAQPGTGSTLQAVRAHNYDDPLATPGEADVTAHVDFAALARAASAAGAEVRTLIGQGDFLIRLGLVDRANVLGRGKDQKTRDAIASGIERLAAPKAMGTLFKVLAVSAPGLKLPLFDPIEIGAAR
ncbi:MAG TPA: class I SAM-dependent methyltransferase [Bauldia sp.]|nr:class I SAM-dependent methyltransferase [Bauldia sp.]